MRDLVMWTRKINFAAGPLNPSRIVVWVFVFCLVTSLYFSKPAQADSFKTGRDIMNEVYHRHELYPYVFEEQTMVLMDNVGNRDVRKMRRFSRVEEDETLKYLLIFDNPVEIRGVALLAVRHPSNHVDNTIYLPAFGKEFKSNSGNRSGNQFLGSDFTMEDLTLEILSDFRYVKLPDQKIDKTIYLTVDAFPLNKNTQQDAGYSRRRHFIKKDNLCITRTDYFDRRGRFYKRKTLHDIHLVNKTMWRPNMVLMENHKELHKTLIIINRRIFSRDYVLPEMFNPDWLLENRHMLGSQRRIGKRNSKSMETNKVHHSNLPQG
jgi:hypothetical protein